MPLSPRIMTAKNTLKQEGIWSKQQRYQERVCRNKNTGQALQKGSSLCLEHASFLLSPFILKVSSYKAPTKHSLMLPPPTVRSLLGDILDFPDSDLWVCTLEFKGSLKFENCVLHCTVATLNHKFLEYANYSHFGPILPLLLPSKIVFTYSSQLNINAKVPVKIFLIFQKFDVYSSVRAPATSFLILRLDV